MTAAAPVPTRSPHGRSEQSGRTYRHPPDVDVRALPQRLHALVRAGGRGIALDDALLALWRAADSRGLAEIGRETRGLGLTGEATAACIGLLCEAGLLLRSDETTPWWERPLPAASLHGTLPLVSVVIPTHDAPQHLEPCLRSLARQSYPRIEVVVVDNASGPEIARLLQAPPVPVTCVRFDSFRGLGEALNRGMRTGRGELLLIINDDTELDPRCVEWLVAAQQGVERIAAVVPKLRFLGAKPFLNGIGNSVGAHGWGYDNAIGHLDLGQFDQVREVPSACSAALLCRREALEAIGGHEESFVIYYDDVDWCQRAWTLGYRVLAEPSAVVYHHFGATMGTELDRGPTRRKLQLVVSNRLRYALRNLERPSAMSFVRNYLLEDARSVLAAARRLDRASLAAYASGWSALLRHLRADLRHRNWLAQRRVNRDARASGLAGQFPPPLMTGAYPLLTWDVVQAHYLPLLRAGRGRSLPELSDGAARRLLIVSPDVVGSNMAGPGVRSWETAKALRRELDVTLAVPGSTDLRPDGFRVASYEHGVSGSLRPLLAEADVVLISNYLVNLFPELRALPQHVIVDLYNPFTLENIEVHADKPVGDQMFLHSHGVGVVNELLKSGDFFICATERQRDFWIGMLLANNRLNPLTYRPDPSLRRLIDVAPFGVPEEPPRRSGPPTKGGLPGIGAEDRLVVWAGGIWDWFDPITAIRAMPAVIDRVPNARLLFIGVRHPNRRVVPDSRAAAQAEALSRELGLLGKHVFFQAWTPYEDRANHLLDADLGLTLHLDHVEARFASRTRLLDHLWVGLPTVATRGDELAETLAAHGLARLVDAGDVAGVARAITETLEASVDREALRRRAAALRRSLEWRSVVEPVRRFCLAPHHAHDRVTAAAPGPAPITPPWKLPLRAWQVWRVGGWRPLAEAVLGYFQWQLIRSRS